MFKKTNIPMLNNVRRQAIKLSKFGEATLFISQHIDNEPTEATVMIQLVKRDDDADEVALKDEAFLQMRRLLTALQYRLDRSVGMDFKFTLKQKKKV